MTERYIFEDNSQEALKKTKEERSSSEKEKNTTEKEKNIRSKKRKDESSQNALVEPKKWRAEDIQRPYPFINQINYYTNLNAIREHIYWIEGNHLNFKRPNPIEKDRSKRDPRKFCHTTTMSAMILMNVFTSRKGLKIWSIRDTSRNMREIILTRRTRSQLALAQGTPYTTFFRCPRGHKNYVWRTLYWGWIEESPRKICLRS